MEVVPTGVGPKTKRVGGEPLRKFDDVTPAEKGWIIRPGPLFIAGADVGNLIA